MVNVLFPIYWQACWVNMIWFIFFHFFFQKIDLTFHTNCLPRRQFACNVKSHFFGEKEKKNIISVSFAECAEKVLKVKQENLCHLHELLMSRINSPGLTIWTITISMATGYSISPECSHRDNSNSSVDFTYIYAGPIRKISIFWKWVIIKCPVVSAIASPQFVLMMTTIPGL